MHTLAHRSDLAPRARQLLAAQLAECGALLQPLLEEALDDLEHELFRIAEQSSGGQIQHEALEALRQTKQSRDGFQPRVMALLEQRLATFGQSTASPETAAAATRGELDLSLVDPRDFDESIAQDDLSTRTELHAGNALFDLYLRYAVLIAAPPLDADALPCGPHALARVLGEALQGLGLYPSQRLLFYRLCERRLSAAAEVVYGRLNDLLKTAGVLPYLRSYLPRRAKSVTRASESAAAAGPMPSPLGAITEYSPAAAPAADTPAAMPELHELLGARRNALASNAKAPAIADGQRAASARELDAALAALQARPAPPAGAHPSERLQRDLLAELRRATPGRNPTLPAGEQRDTMELVTLLYDQMFAETRAEGCAQQLLAGLQVPLLRVAMADSDFFTVRAHPARRLLNSVLEIANLWLDRSDGQFDSALHQRLQRSVQRVATEYQGDLGVIEGEADGLESHVRQLKRRAEIAERRQVEAAQGRDRLREARKTASTAVAIRMAHAHPSPLVRALLEHAWVDVLTLTLLRDGERSEAWRRRLAAADKLLDPSASRDHDALTAELHGGLMQVGLQAAEAAQLVHHALDLPPPATPTQGTPPTQTELLVRLKSRRPEEPEAAAAATGAPHKVPLNVAEREALTTLKALPFGAWLEFTVNQQGQKVARKLAWHNPISGRCLLVNARGVPGPEHTLEQVARLMARGLAHPLPLQSEGSLDRVWDALVSGLRRFGRSDTISRVST